MGKVVDIKRETCPEVIELIDNCQGMIEQNNFVNCAVVFVQADGGVHTAVANNVKRFSLIGGLEILKHEYCGDNND